jgi:hypothetical protein
MWQRGTHIVCAAAIGTPSVVVIEWWSVLGLYSSHRNADAHHNSATAAAEAAALHPHPATLKLCPYVDCGASAIRHGWQWATSRREHPDYAAIPERNVVYAR